MSTHLIRGLLAGLLLGSGAYAPAQTPSLEYQVKASYLYNFIRFVDWPGDVFSGGKFQLCVSGNDHFGAALDSLAGERIEGREIVIRRLDFASQARAQRCQLLFIGAGDATGLDPVISDRGLLTVGETRGFIEHGGIINLVESRGRIRFQINQRAAQQAGLVISSRLLSLAMEVTP